MSSEFKSRVVTDDGRGRSQTMTMRRRIARENELTVMQNEIINWLNKLLSKKVQLSDIITGVPLCQALINMQKQQPAMNLGRIRCRNNASSVFIANENIQTFLNACTQLGVPKILMIDPIEVTQLKGNILPRNFILCILTLSRKVYEEFHIEPPDMIKDEIEIEQLRKKRLAQIGQERDLMRRKAQEEADRRLKEWKESRKERQRIRSQEISKGVVDINDNDNYDDIQYAIVEDDDIDKAVGLIIKNYDTTKLLRLERGLYQLDDNEFYVRLIHQCPLVWHDSKWMELSSYLENNNIKRKDDNNNNNNNNRPSTIEEGDEVEEIFEDIVPMSFRIHNKKDIQQETLRLNASVIENANILNKVLQVKQPLSDNAKALGQLWFESSGAQDKMKKSDITYDNYVKEGKVNITVDNERLIQVNDDKLQSFIENIPSHINKIDFVTNILSALSNRMSCTLDAPSLQKLALILSGFLDEEKVFWLLASLCEDLRSPDFYLINPPPPMQGLLRAQIVLWELTKANFPSLSNHLGQEGQQLTNYASRKWWPNLFIDSLSFETMLCSWCYFFRPSFKENDADKSLVGGDISLLRAVCVIFEAAQSSIETTNISNAREKLDEIVRNMSPEEMLKGLSDRWFAALQLQQWNDKANRDVNYNWNNLTEYICPIAQVLKLQPVQIKAIADELQSNAKGSNVVSKEVIKDILRKNNIQCTPDTIDKLWKIAGSLEPGGIDYQLLVCALTILLSDEGSLSQQMQLCYDVLNPLGKGVSPEDFNKMCKALVSVNDNDNIDDVIEFYTPGALMSVDEFNRQILDTPQLLQVFLIASSPLTLPTNNQPLLITAPQYTRHKCSRYCSCYNCFGGRGYHYLPSSVVKNDAPEAAPSDSLCSLM